jgi:hypothetical protein
MNVAQLFESDGFEEAKFHAGLVAKQATALCAKMLKHKTITYELKDNQGVVEVISNDSYEPLPFISLCYDLTRDTRVGARVSWYKMDGNFNKLDGKVFSNAEEAGELFIEELKLALEWIKNEAE